MCTFMYLYITVLSKFLHKCVMLCISVEWLVVCGVITSIGPGLLCLQAATMAPHPACVGTDCVCLFSRLGICRNDGPLYY
jgi:hypothetical protein